jgi:hypothetical protein
VEHAVSHGIERRRYRRKKSLDRSRRRGVAGSSAGTWSSSRYLGLVFTPHRAARAPLHRCGRRGYHRGILRFVLTAVGKAASPLLHQHAGANVDITSIRHQEVALTGKEKTLDEIWRKKTMRRRKLAMRELGFSLASLRTLFISNFKWAFMNYRSNEKLRALTLSSEKSKEWWKHI